MFSSSYTLYTSGVLQINICQRKINKHASFSYLLLYNKPLIIISNNIIAKYGPVWRCSPAGPVCQASLLVSSTSTNFDVISECRILGFVPICHRSVLDVWFPFVHVPSPGLPSRFIHFQFYHANCIISYCTATHISYTYLHTKRYRKGSYINH